MDQGFRTADGRLVFSIIFDLECPPPQILQMVVHLDKDGNSRNWRITRPADPNKRIVNCGPGEFIRINGKKHRVTAVRAYRWVKDGRVDGWP